MSNYHLKSRKKFLIIQFQISSETKLFRKDPEIQIKWKVDNFTNQTNMNHLPFACDPMDLSRL